MSNPKQSRKNVKSAFTRFSNFFNITKTGEKVKS